MLLQRPTAAQMDSGTVADTRIPAAPLVCSRLSLQVMKAFAEAEAHKGVSLIVAYAPCVMQGISDGMSCSVTEARTAVEVGYWPLYRCALGAVVLSSQQSLCGVHLVSCVSPPCLYLHWFFAACSCQLLNSWCCLVIFFGREKL
jgi:hypothetical protein